MDFLTHLLVYNLEDSLLLLLIAKIKFPIVILQLAVFVNGSTRQWTSGPNQIPLKIIRRRWFSSAKAAEANRPIWPGLCHSMHPAFCIIKYDLHFIVYKNLAYRIETNDLNFVAVLHTQQSWMEVENCGPRLPTTKGSKRRFIRFQFLNSSALSYIVSFAILCAIFMIVCNTVTSLAIIAFTCGLCWIIIIIIIINIPFSKIHRLHFIIHILN